MKTRLFNVYEPIKLGGEVCWYCGDKLTPFNKTSDHFWPKHLRGRLKVACCASCNTLKGGLTPNGFIDLVQNLKLSHLSNHQIQRRCTRIMRATWTLWERTKQSV